MPKAPGDLVEMDAADIRFLPGEVHKHFTARDVVGRRDVLDVHHRATGLAAASFLGSILERIPFRSGPSRWTEAQSSRPSLRRAASGAPSYSLRCRPAPLSSTDTWNAHRTPREEFHQMLDPPDSLDELRDGLRAQETVYNTIRPHQALGQRTPFEFYQEWIATRTTERG